MGMQHSGDALKHQLCNTIMRIVQCSLPSYLWESFKKSSLPGIFILSCFCILCMCACSLAPSVPLAPLSKTRCAHLHICPPTGSYNHGEDATPQVLDMQANGRKRLTCPTFTFVYSWKVFLNLLYFLGNEISLMVYK